MKTWQRVALAILGVAIFVGVWHVGALSMFEKRYRTTMGVAPSKDGFATVVIVDHYRTRAAMEELPLAEGERLKAVETIRILWGAQQPTLGAIPPADEMNTKDVRAIFELAKKEFGSGLEMVEIAVPTGGDSAARAEARAIALQGQRIAWSHDIPTPAESIVALVEMVGSGTLPKYIIASLFRVGMGFALAVLIGIPFGLAFGSFPWFAALSNSLVQVLRPISPIAWLPVATIMFGGGDKAAVYLIFYCAVFPITITTAAAVAAIDLKYRRSALNFGVGGLDFAKRVLLPAALPMILTGLRVAIGISWLVVVAAEMLGVESGLGFLVLDARNQTRYDRVVAAMIVIGLIGLVIDVVMRWFERNELERRGIGVR